MSSIKRQQRILTPTIFLSNMDNFKKHVGEIVCWTILAVWTGMWFAVGVAAVLE